MLCATTLLAAMLSFGIIVARGLGAHNAFPIDYSVLSPDKDCPHPCWQGIVPGKTDLEQTLRMLEQHRDAILSNISGAELTIHTDNLQVCWTLKRLATWHGCASQWGPSGMKGPVTMIMLVPPENALSVGDMIALLGQPEVISVSNRFLVVPRRNVTMSLFFPGNIEVRTSFRPESERSPVRLTPYAVVRTIIYHSFPFYRFDAPSWRGFKIINLYG